MSRHLRRHDDPEGFDPSTFRDNREEIRFGYHGTTFSARGVGVYLALSVLAIIASNVFSGWRVEQAILETNSARKAEHRTLSIYQDRTSCIVSLTTEEKVRFRSEYVPGAFKKWCPWAEEP